MSKFAAIEARQTEYPANVNDVVWLVARVRDLRTALTQLLASHVESGPYYEDAIRALEALEAPNVPV